MSKYFKRIGEKRKKLSRKQKFDYYWKYYKFYALALILIAILVGDFFYKIYNNKEIFFYATFINALSIEDGEKNLKKEFIKKVNLDEDLYDVCFDSSLYIDFEATNSDMTGQQTLINMITAKELDLIGSDETTFKYLAYDNAFIDLRTYLSFEELEIYKEYFYYIDKDTLDAIHSSDIEDFYNYEMPKDYNNMANPIPVGFKIDNTIKLGESYIFKGSSGVIGILKNTQRLEATKEFILVAMN